MKQKFIKQLKEQLYETMNTAKTGLIISDADIFRFEGFMQAGVELDIVTNEEILKLIKTVHENVYGESIIARLRKEKIIRLH